jgi:hypothetical protein
LPFALAGFAFFAGVDFFVALAFGFFTAACFVAEETTLSVPGPGMTFVSAPLSQRTLMRLPLRATTTPDRVAAFDASAM